MFFVLIILSSCNNDDNNYNDARLLRGRWLWVSSTGGFSGGTITASKDKNELELEFSATHLTTYTDGIVTTKRKYFIVNKESIFGGYKNMIITEKENAIDQEFSINESYTVNGDELILASECYDCYTSKYKKVK